MTITRFSLAGVTCSLLAGALILLCGASPARGQAAAPASTCHPSDWRVLSPTRIAIRCSELDVGGVVLPPGSVFSLAPAAITKFSDTSAAAPVPGDQEWLSIKLERSLHPAQKYRLFLGADQSIVFDFDTNESISLGAPITKSESGHNEYLLTSKLAFKGERGNKKCAFVFQDHSGKKATITGECTYKNNVLGEWVDRDDLATLLAEKGLAQVGQVTVRLDQSPLDTSFLRQLPVGIEGLVDIFDHPLKLDPKAKFVAQQAPATKAASQYYINASYGAGVASKPGWILDTQFAPSLNSLPGGFQIVPISASADIGHNTISGQTFTDKINIGSSAGRGIPLRGILQEVLFSPSVMYETDREFDRHNLLGIVDFRYNFAHLYNPQSTRSLQEFAKLMRKLEDFKKKSPPGTPMPPPPQPEDIKPPLFGYALDFHTGAELGGALVDTTVKATSGTASLALPAYNIARIVPQVHGLLQICKFSVEETLTGHYLLATENTIIPLPNGTLTLERLNNWKAYSALTGTWNVDSAGHFGFTVSYKDGFAPPKFQRINTVVTGVLVKY